jgi:hypothetical protein
MVVSRHAQDHLRSVGERKTPSASPSSLQVAWSWSWLRTSLCWYWSHRGRCAVPFVRIAVFAPRTLIDYVSCISERDGLVPIGQRSYPTLFAMSTSSYTPYQPADASTSYATQADSYPQYPIQIQQFEQLQPQAPPTPKRPETGRIRENISQADSASCINQQVASLAVRRFTTACLKKEGFLTAEPDAMLRLETEVLACALPIMGVLPN